MTDKTCETCLYRSYYTCRKFNHNTITSQEGHYFSACPDWYDYIKSDKYEDRKRTIDQYTKYLNKFFQETAPKPSLPPEDTGDGSNKDKCDHCAAQTTCCREFPNDTCYEPLYDPDGVPPTSQGQKYTFRNFSSHEAATSFLEDRNLTLPIQRITSLSGTYYQIVEPKDPSPS